MAVNFDFIILLYFSNLIFLFYFRMKYSYYRYERYFERLGYSSKTSINNILFFLFFILFLKYRLDYIDTKGISIIR